MVKSIFDLDNELLKLDVDLSFILENIGTGEENRSEELKNLLKQYMDKNLE